MKQLSPHFHEREFVCRCCGSLGPGMDQGLIERLELIRIHFGKPVHINSGYRCPNHNTRVGGAKYSQHMKGTAADITVRDVKPSTVYKWIDKWHEGGLGRYNSFTHVDTRGSKARW